MGLCGSNVNLEPEEDDSFGCLEKKPIGGWDKASLEIAIISLSERLNRETQKALTLKRRKKIKQARKILRDQLKPMQGQLKDLRERLTAANKKAMMWTEEEKRDVLTIQPSHLRVVPKIVTCDAGEIRRRYDVSESSIGDGMCGDVKKITCIKTGGSFALKTLSKQSIDKVVLDMLRLEIEILAALDHPNVVHVVEAFETPDNILLVLELGRGGDLFEYVSKQKNRKLPLEHARSIIWQMSLGIAHCHAQGIVHRDIKLENFVFATTPEATKPLPRLQLIDFGLAKQWQPPGSTNHIQVRKMNTVVGTLDTSAPEVRDRNVMYTSKCDMWSLGAVAFKVLSGHYPFQDANRDRVLEKIRNGTYCFDKDRGWNGIPENARDFVRKLLRVEPSERMTARETLRHPFISGMTQRRVSKASMSTVLEAMRRFSKLNALQRTALLVHAHIMHCGKVGIDANDVSLHEIFVAMDRDHSGDVTLEEFKTTARRVCKLSNDELEAIYCAIDQDDSERVHYTEFLAAALFARPDDVVKYDVDVETVFARLDADKTGTISMQNLKDFFGESCNDDRLHEILGFDRSNESNSKVTRSGSINLLRFKTLMGRVRDVCMSTNSPLDSGGPGATTKDNEA